MIEILSCLMGYIACGWTEIKYKEEYTVVQICTEKVMAYGGREGWKAVSKLVIETEEDEWTGEESHTYIFYLGCTTET